MYQTTEMCINLTEKQGEGSYFETLINIWCGSDLLILATFYSIM